MSINLCKILFSDSIWHYCLKIIALVVEAIKNVYSPGKTSKISVVPWDGFNMSNWLLITAVLNRPSATHPSQIFLHFHSISLRWPIYINWVDKNKLSSLERLFRPWPSERAWLGLSTRLRNHLVDFLTLLHKLRRETPPKNLLKPPPFCDLRLSKAGAYQRLLTSKYFLRSTRKQNAPLPFPSRSNNRTPPSTRTANQNRAMIIIALPTCTR